MVDSAHSALSAGWYGTPFDTRNNHLCARVGAVAVKVVGPGQILYCYVRDKLNGSHHRLALILGGLGVRRVQGPEYLVVQKGERGRKGQACVRCRGHLSVRGAASGPGAGITRPHLGRG